MDKRFILELVLHNVYNQGVKYGDHDSIDALMIIFALKRKTDIHNDMLLIWSCQHSLSKLSIYLFRNHIINISLEDNYMKHALYYAQRNKMNSVLNVIYNKTRDDINGIFPVEDRYLSYVIYFLAPSYVVILIGLIYYTMYMLQWNKQLIILLFILFVIRKKLFF